jgi:hypothetical protein
MPGIARGMLGVYSSRALAENNVPLPDPLQVVSVPGLLGLATVGQTLTTNEGEYRSNSTVTTTGQFLRDGVAISGATGTSYELVLADVGAVIQYQETATNSTRSVTALSNPIGPVAAALVAPTASTAPTINDTTPTEGQTLTITAGTYAGTSPITTARWMQRSTTDVASLGTGTSYTVQAGDVGSTLRVREVATNVAGSSSNNFSSATSTVAAALTAPIIADATFGPILETAQVGATIGQVVNTGGTVGTWSINAGPFAISTTGLITLATPLDYGTASSHTQTVTATNDAGSDTATITVNVAEVTGGISRIAGLTITGTGAPADTVVPFAMAFKQGDLATTDPVLIRRDDTTAQIRTQINVLSTWTDGSVKHALMALECPSLASNVTLACSIFKGESHSSPGSAINMATALSGRTASIVHTPATGSAHTFNPLASIGSADWWSGPLYASKRVQVLPIPSENMGGRTSVRLCVDVGISKDGILDLDVSTRNDLVQEVGGGVATYARTISIDGVTQHTFSQFDHVMYGWMTRRASRANGGAAPTRPWITHDYGYLLTTRLVPSYDRSITVNPADITSQITTPLAAGNLALPYDRWGLARDAGTSGGRPEIGRLPFSSVIWLMQGLPDAQRHAQIWCEIETVKDYNHHMRALDRPLNCVDAPKFSAGVPNQNTSVAGTPFAAAQGFPSDQRPANSSDANKALGILNNDDAHQGAYHYIPALLSGRRMAFDSIASRAAWCSVGSFNREIPFGTSISWRNYTPSSATGVAWAVRGDLAAAPDPQARGRANTLRDSGRAAAILPNDWPNRQFYNENALAQVNVFAANLTRIQETMGDLAGLIRSSSGQAAATYGGNKEHTPGYMNAMYRWVLTELVGMGVTGPNGAAWLNLTARAIANGFNTSAFNWRNAAAGFDLFVGSWVGTQPTQYNTTWAQVQTQQEDPATSGAMNVLSNWAPVRSSLDGGWNRQVYSSLCVQLDSPDITEDRRMDLADALIKFRNERPGGGITPPFPRTDPDAGFADDIQLAMVPVGSTVRFDVAPTVRAGQSFSVASSAANGTRFGLIRTDGGLPRGPSSDAVGAFVITSQPAGNPFSVSQGGVLTKVGAVTTGAKTVSVYATNFDNASTETRGATVNVTVNVT